MGHGGDMEGIWRGCRGDYGGDTGGTLKESGGDMEKTWRGHGGDEVTWRGHGGDADWIWRGCGRGTEGTWGGSRGRSPPHPQQQSVRPSAEPPAGRGAVGRAGEAVRGDAGAGQAAGTAPQPQQHVGHAGLWLGAEQGRMERGTSRSQKEALKMGLSPHLGLQRGHAAQPGLGLREQRGPGLARRPGGGGRGEVLQEVQAGGAQLRVQPCVGVLGLQHGQGGPGERTWGCSPTWPAPKMPPVSPQMTPFPLQKWPAWSPDVPFLHKTPHFP